MECSNEHAAHASVGTSSKVQIVMVLHFLILSPNPTGAVLLSSHQLPPPGIQYKRVTSDFFAVSSIRDGRTWYNRCNRANGYMNCILINYPASEERQWDAVVTRISLSLAK